jgi:hypothetical protein
MLGHRCIVFLGENDSIINASKVLTYLQSKTKANGETKHPSQVGPHSEVESPWSVVWCANLDHGQIFDLPDWRLRLKCEVLREAQQVD